jgi:hypothetical protein
MALFRTIDEVRQYVKLDVNLKFDKLKPSIDEAQEQYLKPLLGNEFYEEFKTAYEGAANVPDDLSADNKALLPYIQRSLAYYACFLAIDELGASVGDLGIQQSFNQNSQPAPSYKVNALKVKYITAGDRNADKLLEYLELNATSSKYQTWFEDENANTARSGLIVYKTAIASKYVDINESRRVYLRLRKRITDIEQQYVKRLICSDQYDALVTQLKAGTVTAENKKLIDKLEPIISKKALYLTLPSLAISVEAEGIVLYSSNDSVIQKQTATTEDKKALAYHLRDGEFGYLSDESTLTNFLEGNIADYPLISASPCWTSKPEDGEISWKVENDPCNKHFSV